MTTQTESLQLAEWLEDQYDPTGNQDRAAAELRRLHDLLGKANALARIRAERIAKQDALLRQALDALEIAQKQLAVVWSTPTHEVDGTINAIQQQLEGKV